MKEGDLVRVKSFYRLDEDYDSFGVLVDMLEDDDGLNWYQIAPFECLNGIALNWYVDSEIEVVSEM